MSVFSRLNVGFGNRTPVILQTQSAECGLACSAMVAGRYGLNMDLMAVRRRFNCSMKGMTFADLVKAAQRLGLATRPVKADMEDLPKLRLPCILHWRFNHFVVLEQITRKSVVLHDPALGRRIVSSASISSNFTGVALELWPTLTFEKRTERDRVSLLRLFPNVIVLKRAFGQILLFSICLEMVLLLAPIGFQVIVDQAIVGTDIDLLTVVILGLVLLLALQAALAFSRSWVIMILKTDLNVQWSSGLFEHLAHLPLT